MFTYQIVILVTKRGHLAWSRKPRFQGEVDRQMEEADLVTQRIPSFYDVTEEEVLGMV